MSAFLCSDKHTFIVAAEMVKLGLAADAISCAMQLRDANNKALAALYRDNPVPLGSLANMKTGEWTVIQVSTLARCLAYQCSDGDVMETHPAGKMLDAMIAKLGGDQMPIAEGLWGRV